MPADCLGERAGGQSESECVKAGWKTLVKGQAQENNYCLPERKKAIKKKQRYLRGEFEHVRFYYFLRLNLNGMRPQDVNKLNDVTPEHC